MKPFKEYYAAERDATDAQISAFVAALIAHHEAETSKHPDGYPGVFRVSRHDPAHQARAAEAGFDLDNRGNEDAVHEDPAFKAFDAANHEAYTAYHARKLDEARVQREADIEAVVAQYADHPAIQRQIRERCAFAARGSRSPKVAPRDWKARLSRSNNPYGGAATSYPAYTQVAEKSGAKLLLDRAVDVASTQESYADYYWTLIPVEIGADFNREAASRNLGRIAQSLQTHNGWAGSGSTFEFDLKVEDDGAYVVMTQRASIPD